MISLRSIFYSLFCCIRKERTSSTKNKIIVENKFQPDSPFTEEEMKRGYTYVML
jgi:hypothetical protein